MNNRGAILLEVVVALWIVSLAGLAAIQLSRAVMADLQEMHMRERELRAADHLLYTYSLATTLELDQRIGGQRMGRFAVTVQRPSPGLYRVAVARAAAAEVELLVTVVYRKAAPE